MVAITREKPIPRSVEFGHWRILCGNLQCVQCGQPLLLPFQALSYKLLPFRKKNRIDIFTKFRDITFFISNPIWNSITRKSFSDWRRFPFLFLEWSLLKFVKFKGMNNHSCPKIRSNSNFNGHGKTSNFHFFGLLKV